MDFKTVKVGGGKVNCVEVGRDNPLVFIGGPCAIENEDHTLFMAEKINIICIELGIKWIFKACYDKDCRSSKESFHGVGISKGLNILSKVRDEFQIPVVSDFSDASWASETAEVCDLIQIPAYLCRQTSILKSAANTKKPIHLKKGQFMSPWNMKNSVKKLEKFGSDQIILTERGTFFGYNQLVNDMTAFPIMRRIGYPVCYDATHSIQLPTSMGNISGGQREFIPFLVRAACACGINALFMEVHNNPSQALSDSNTVLDLKFLKMILEEAIKIHQLRIQLTNKNGEFNVHDD
jgi:2-dehydro-3-deoxyphosphooctonate aldolase (KDO 8-P synthase)